MLGWRARKVMGWRCWVRGRGGLIWRRDWGDVTRLRWVCACAFDKRVRATSLVHVTGHVRSQASSSACWMGPSMSSFTIMLPCITSRALGLIYRTEAGFLSWPTFAERFLGHKKSGGKAAKKAEYIQAKVCIK